MAHDRRRGDKVDGYKVKVRKELEDLLLEKTEKHYEVEADGILTKKITPADIYNAVKHLNKSNYVQGQFLLHLDDRMTEFNGFREEVQTLQKDVTEYCNDRTESCPILPLVKGLEDGLTEHLAEEEREHLVETVTADLKRKWRDEGRRDEQQRFERAAKIVGLLLTGVTVATATITWLLGMWGLRGDVIMVMEAIGLWTFF